jgi:hypothetical protein
MRRERERERRREEDPGQNDQRAYLREGIVRRLPGSASSPMIWLSHFSIMRSLFRVARPVPSSVFIFGWSMAHLGTHLCVVSAVKRCGESVEGGGKSKCDCATGMRGEGLLYQNT